MSQIIRKYGDSQASHRHDSFHQIVIPVKGDLEMEIGNHGGVVTGSRLGIVSQGEIHAFRARDDNAFLVLDIAIDAADERFNRIWNRAIDAPFPTMSEALLSLTDYAVFCSRRDQSAPWLSSWRQLFLETLVAELDNDLPALPQRIGRAIDYMRANLDRPIENADLARESCLSPARFHELFRDATGVSPRQYLLECRLKAAKRLILDGRSLAETADAVGFSDQSSFSRAFRRATGLSPGAWRKTVIRSKQS